MPKGEIFVIEYLELSSIKGGAEPDPGLSDACRSSSSHYAEGSNKADCCCMCEKEK